MSEPIKLNNLYNLSGSKHNFKRVGRGIGSGKGKTCGKGQKGQKSRCGVSIKGFEGGQMPLIARLPKRGFNPPKRRRFSIVSLNVINHLAETEKLKGETKIDKELLVNLKIVKSTKERVKLLGEGKLVAKLSFFLDAYSTSARECIAQSGGQVS